MLRIVGLAILSFATLVLSTGCASGGYKITRQYAGFVNKQNIIIRIVLYLFTSVVFAVTLLVDMVVFNTMDFWEGRVSQGTYEFNKDGKTYTARHEVIEGLKKSTIDIADSKGMKLQNVVIRETAGGEVELFVDGQLRTRVQNIKDVTVAYNYNAKGSFISKEIVPMPSNVASLTR